MGQRSMNIWWILAFGREMCTISVALYRQLNYILISPEQLN